jgi:hypothetical protein
MGKLVGEVSVVSQDQQTLTVGVQAADVEKSLFLERSPGSLGEHVGNGAATFRIIHGDDDPTRLIEGQIEMSARWWDTRAIDSNHVTFGIDPAALLGDDLGVNLDTALADHGFTRPARAYAGLGKHLLEAYTICRLAH